MIIHKKIVIVYILLKIYRKKFEIKPKIIGNLLVRLYILNIFFSILREEDTSLHPTAR